MCKMSAMIKIHSHYSVSRLYKCKKYRKVSLCA